MTSPRLPYGRQWIDDADRAAVDKVLQGDWLTQGPEVEAFEADFAAQVGAAHAVAVANGTAALHLACLAAGLEPGQTLLTTPITFLASANCGIYCGAEVAFADVAASGPLMDRAAVDRSVATLRARGARPTVLIPVHYAGLCCDMAELAEVAQANGMTVIEDACHALGASWQDRSGAQHRVGACSHSAMSVFSFHPVKHITTGEGGMITTRSAELAARLRKLRSHGMEKCEVTRETGGWAYVMSEVGYNYRLTDLQSALGRSQLRHLDAWIERRREIVAQYHQAFAGLNWCRMLVEPPGQKASYHLAVLQLTSSGAQSDIVSLGRRRRRLYDFLVGEGIGVQVHYIPIYRQPYYQRRWGLRPEDYPHAEAFYWSCLSLPCFPRMTGAEVERVIETVGAAEKQLQLGSWADGAA